MADKKKVLTIKRELVGVIKQYPQQRGVEQILDEKFYNRPPRRNPNYINADAFLGPDEVREGDLVYHETLVEVEEG